MALFWEVVEALEPEAYLLDKEPLGYWARMCEYRLPSCSPRLSFSLLPVLCYRFLMPLLPCLPLSYLVPIQTVSLSWCFSFKLLLCRFSSIVTRKVASAALSKGLDSVAVWRKFLLREAWQTVFSFLLRIDKEDIVDTETSLLYIYPTRYLNSGLCSICAKLKHASIYFVVFVFVFLARVSV